MPPGRPHVRRDCTSRVPDNRLEGVVVAVAKECDDEWVTSPREVEAPLGLLGTLLLVGLIESAVGRNERHYTQVAAENWKESERQAHKRPDRG